MDVAWLPLGAAASPRKYFARMKQVGKPPEQRKLKVDAAASRRFIDGALSGDRVWQTARGGAGRRHGHEAGGIGRSTPAGQPQDHRYHDKDGRKGREARASSGGSAKEDDDGPARRTVPGSLTSPPSGSVKRKHLAKGSEGTDAAGSADKRIKHGGDGTKRGSSHEAGGSDGGRGRSSSAGADKGGAGTGKSAREPAARGKPGSPTGAPSWSRKEKGRRK